MKAGACAAPGLGGTGVFPFPRSLGLWVIWIVCMNAAGWALSGLQALTLPGYLAALGATAAALAWLWKQWSPPARGRRTGSWRRLARRFRRPFALAFLVLAGLELLGGLLHLPNNFDGLAYRVPRVLHWLAQGGWHWIPTEFHLLNTRAPVWEWAAAPILLLTGGFHLTFLICFISFLLMPGAVYSTLIRLGVRRRVAWYWMWLLPCGYCYLLHAGSIANEFPGSLLALAAVNFALRARETGRLSEVWLSVLSAAAMTGAKATNLPLLLPWALALLPVAALLLRRIWATTGVLLLALSVSVVPITVANLHYSKDLFGFKAERNRGIVRTDTSLYLPMNTVYLTLQNAVPPIFPMAERWNAWIASLMTPEFARRMAQVYPPSAAQLRVVQMSTESLAGLGSGLCLLLAASVPAGWWLRRRSRCRPVVLNWLLLLSPWVSLIALLYRANISALARVAAPYYPLLVPLLLVGCGQALLVRRKVWQWAGISTFLLALAPVILSPARPLFPVNAVLARMPAGIAARMESAYIAGAKRPVLFAPLLAALPPGTTRVGLVASNVAEAGLWSPFGSRTVVHITREDTVETLRAKGVEYLFIRDQPQIFFPEDPGEWVARQRLVSVADIPLRMENDSEPTLWRVMKLPPAP